MTESVGFTGEGNVASITHSITYTLLSASRFGIEMPLSEVVTESVGYSVFRVIANGANASFSALFQASCRNAHRPLTVVVSDGVRVSGLNVSALIASLLRISPSCTIGVFKEHFLTISVTFYRCFVVASGAFCGSGASSAYQIVSEAVYRAVGRLSALRANLTFYTVLGASCRRYDRPLARMAFLGYSIGVSSSALFASSGLQAR